jgi:very-short-patch-repair endonuclease
MRQTRKHAWEMRRRPTEVEARLWYYLRRRNVAGRKFRRQHPIGPFIADFACLSRRLLIEVDGGQHDADRQERNARTKYLLARGYHVIRFWNHEVVESPELVIDIILVHLQCTPPQPSPAFAGEGVEKRRRREK